VSLILGWLWTFTHVTNVGPLGQFLLGPAFALALWFGVAAVIVAVVTVWSIIIDVLRGAADDARAAPRWLREQREVRAIRRRPEPRSGDHEDDPQ
jgi:hypothetical protein